MTTRAPALEPTRDAAERRAIEAAQRDPARFDELYEANFERVYAYVARRVRDRDAACDLTSEVFHRALANIGHFEWRGVPFIGWLLRIAAHAIADRGARVARDGRAVEALEWIDGAAVPAVDLADAEARAHLFRCVDALPADQARVLMLRFAEEHSIREIATALGRSEGAVKQLQFRGLQALRARLSGHL
jgi:RNA polymerase sigma-70 factor (ECF subfamily)